MHKLLLVMQIKQMVLFHKDGIFHKDGLFFFLSANSVVPLIVLKAPFRFYIIALMVSLGYTQVLTHAQLDTK